MDLKGKVALVTGAGVRVGKALALAIAEHGGCVVAHYHSSAGPVEETVRQVEALGSDAVALQADLASVDQARALMERAVAHYGQIDILVNSAAIFEEGRWHDTMEASWDRHFAINLRAPFFLSQAFATHVGRIRRGHIVNIADWRGVRPGLNHMAYTLTKAALIAMTQSLALALAPNIQVNAIAPGMILPPPGEGQEWMERWAQRRVPLKRPGSPEEVAGALIYLLQSDFVTGELLFVTGGEQLRTTLSALGSVETGPV